MKKESGITIISLVVTIIILIILAGISINLTIGEDGLITKAKQAKENIQLAQVEEQTRLNQLYGEFESELGSSGDIDYAAVVKLAEFKKAIADYIGEAGGIKPEYTAETTTFGDSIKGIVKEVTKNATATADNISEGKTAWINGELVTGNGADNNSSKKDSVQDIIYSIYHNDATNVSLGSTGCSSWAHNSIGSWYADNDSFNYSKEIPLYNIPDGDTAALNIVNFAISLSCDSAYGDTWGRGSMSYSVKTNTGLTLDSGSLSVNHSVNSSGTTTASSDSASKTVTINMFSADIGDATSIIISMSGSTSARAATHKDSQGRGSVSVSNMYATYIPISI